MLADSSSPKATVRFPWSREESAATWGNQQVSIWVRDPAVVTLTVTDASGATGTTTATVNFADSTSNGDEFACAHIGTPPPAPSVPVQVSSGSTDAQARSLFAAAFCRLAGVTCTGDIIGGTPSLADEGRRLLVERKIEQLKERIEELRRDIADALASERRLADEAAATDDQSERTLLIVLAKIAHKGAQEDEELLDKDITELNALDHKDRALVHQLSSKVRPARAAPATPHVRRGGGHPVPYRRGYRRCGQREPKRGRDATVAPLRPAAPHALHLHPDRDREAHRHVTRRDHPRPESPSNDAPLTSTASGGGRDALSVRSQDSR